MHRCILVVSLVAACAPDNVVDTVYDPCSPLTIALEPNITEPELAGVEGAIAAWQHVLPVQIVVGAGPQAVDVLPLYFKPGDTPYRGIYWDNEGTISISRDHLAAEDYPIAIAHEMGHAFGLLHVKADERASVMNVGNTTVAPTEDDAAAVRAHWASCGAQ